MQVHHTYQTKIKTWLTHRLSTSQQTPDGPHLVAPLDLSSQPSQLANSGVPLLDLDLASLHSPLDLSTPPSQLTNNGVPLLDLDLASLHSSLVLSISPYLPLSHSLPYSLTPHFLPPVAKEPVHQSSSLAGLAHRLLHRLPKHNTKVQDIKSGAPGTLNITFTRSWICLYALTNFCLFL